MEKFEHRIFHVEVDDGDFSVKSLDQYWQLIHLLAELSGQINDSYTDTRNFVTYKVENDS